MRNFFVFCGGLRQGFVIYHKLALNSQAPSSFSLPSAKITSAQPPLLARIIFMENNNCYQSTITSENLWRFVATALWNLNSPHQHEREHCMVTNMLLGWSNRRKLKLKMFSLILQFLRWLRYKVSYCSYSEMGEVFSVLRFPPAWVLL